VLGAGAIGGVIGARLFQRGHDVVLIARGAHYRALAEGGLRLETPDESVTLRVPVVAHPSALAFGPEDVVIVAVKSQDTRGALDQLLEVAPSTTGIVCGQNGVENERVALRSFEHVYGMCVMCPATHLEPGLVQASSSPVTGLLDVGVWPGGLDDRARELATLLSGATFDSVAREDIARWKWGKLLMNLGNAVQAVCGASAPAGTLAQRALDEGVAVLAAAGIGFVGPEEDARRRGHLLNVRPIGGLERGGGSSWQSLVRGAGSIETDYLSGEIVLQGRLWGIATPVNSVLQRLANQLASQHRPPGEWTEAEVLAMIDGPSIVSG